VSLGVAETESSLSPLTRASRALALLAVEAASTALAIWTVRMSDRMVGYVSANTLPPTARKFAIGNMMVGAAIACLAAVGLWIWRRAAGLDLIERISRRLAPMCLMAFLPLFFHWQLWVGGRELTFLLLVSAAGLSLIGLARLSLETRPILPERLRARIDKYRARAGEKIRGWPWLPTALVVTGVVGYAIYFSIITLQNHYRLGTSGYDLGIENNLVWNASRFNAPLFKTSVIGGPDSSHIGFHQTYISYLFGIPYRLVPWPQSLLVLQATLSGAAALPLYAYGRRHIGDWAACLVSILLLFYAPLHGSILYDFHYQPFAPFFLWSVLWLLDTRRDKLAAVAVVLTLANREDMSALLVIIGLYLLLTGQRPKAGIVVAAVGAVYFAVVKMTLMPRFLHGQMAYLNQYELLLGEGERTFGGVIKTVFGNPAFTVTSLLEQKKLVYLLQIMTPLAFFPWRRPIGWLFCVPGFFFTLLATRYNPLIEISFQYTAYWTSFLFIAFIANGKWVKENEARGLLRAGTWRSWLIAITATMIVTSYQFGIVMQHNTAVGGFSPFRVGVSPQDRIRHDDLYALIKMIPPTATVAANEMTVAHVSSRKNAYTLKIAHNDADYILVRTPPGGDERTHLLDALKTGAYGVVAEKGEFILFRRGLPRATTDAYIRRIGG
jgi:uncharacterized membrane protein